MQWLIAWHIIAMVTWFAGLFYLPRLYVYHAMSHDMTSIQRFQIMERKLYFGITTPGAVVTTALGLVLIYQNPSYYLHAGWMHAKLALAALLWAYHLYLGRVWWLFKHNRNTHGHVYYRWLNEAPVIALVGMVILAVVKPF